MTSGGQALLKGCLLSAGRKLSCGSLTRWGWFSLQLKWRRGPKRGGIQVKGQPSILMILACSCMRYLLARGTSPLKDRNWHIDAGASDSLHGRACTHIPPGWSWVASGKKRAWHQCLWAYEVLVKASWNNTVPKHLRGIAQKIISGKRSVKSCSKCLYSEDTTNVLPKTSSPIEKCKLLHKYKAALNPVQLSPGWGQTHSVLLITVVVLWMLEVLDNWSSALRL